MGDPVTVIVLVAAGAASEPTTVAMTGATRDALGGAIVQVRETRGSPDDEAALAAEASAHADAVVELGWADPRRRQATLRLHIAAGGRWIERVIRFKPSDAYAERGRTLGFAVASMLPEAAADHGSPPGNPPASLPATPAPTPTASPTTAPAPTPPVPPAPQVPPESPRPPTSATPAPPAPQVPTPPPAPPPPAPPASVPGPATSARSSDGGRGAWTKTGRASAEAATEAAIDLMVLGSVGIGGKNAQTVGGGVAGHWFVLSAVSVRLAGGVRAGTGNRAGVSTLTYLGAAGVAWHPWRPTSSLPLGASLRVDYLVERPKAAYGSQTYGNLNPHAIDAIVEAGWQLSGDADVVLGLGIEDVFITTHITLQGEVATIPPVSAVANAGVRLRF